MSYGMVVIDSLLCEVDVVHEVLNFHSRRVLQTHATIIPPAGKRPDIADSAAHADTPAGNVSTSTKAADTQRAHNSSSSRSRSSTTFTKKAQQKKGSGS